MDIYQVIEALKNIQTQNIMKISFINKNKTNVKKKRDNWEQYHASISVGRVKIRKYFKTTILTR